MRKVFAHITALFAAVMFGLGCAGAAEITLLSANAVKEPLLQLIEVFERSSGHKVVAHWAGTEATTKRISAGEVFDVVVIAAPNIERLIADGKLVSGSKTDFAKTGVGVAVRAGLPAPDIRNAPALKEALLSAKSIAFSQGPSGAYVAQLIQKLGIAEQLKDKIRQTPSGVQVADFIAQGGADLGFQQISELVHAKGIQYLGPLPAEYQNFTTYAAGLHVSASSPDAAAALIKFLVSPGGTAILRKSALEPAS